VRWHRSLRPVALPCNIDVLWLPYRGSSAYRCSISGALDVAAGGENGGATVGYSGGSPGYSGGGAWRRSVGPDARCCRSISRSMRGPHRFPARRMGSVSEFGINHPGWFARMRWVEGWRMCGFCDRASSGGRSVDSALALLSARPSRRSALPVRAPAYQRAAPGRGSGMLRIPHPRQRRYWF
jgi:hypothetical protein